jgi:hypothetical protein
MFSGIFSSFSDENEPSSSLNKDAESKDGLKEETKGSQTAQGAQEGASAEAATKETTNEAAKDEGQIILSCEVPMNATPGSTFHVQLENRFFEVTTPENAKPGQTIHIIVPPEAAAPPPPKDEKLRSSFRNSSSRRLL